MPEALMDDTMDRKALAGIRILVAVARADGKIADEEVEGLRGALGNRAPMLDALLAEDIDLDEEIAVLDDEGDRRRVYESAYALAHVDGYAHSQEVNVLERLIPNQGEDTLLGQVFGEARDTLLPTSLVPIADPSKRDAEVREDMIKYSTLAAVAGAMPVPGVAIIADIAVIALQVKLVRDIGQYWGHRMDVKAARSLMGTVAGATGMRVAVTNLMRFVPGWGSAFGAVTSFATTWALGEMANAYFASGQNMGADDLKSLFEEAKKSGSQQYDAQLSKIDGVREQHGARIAALNEQLAHGTISRAEYKAKMDKLDL